LHESLILMAAAILVFLIYSNTLKGPFVFDGVRNIEKNQHIRLTEITMEGMGRAGFQSPSSNRPVANISFALNYYFHRYNVFGFHIVNIIIHITTGLLLYLFLKSTLSLPAISSRYGQDRWIPLVTTVIWLVHPIQTQSVAYIVQRMNSLAALFYILSFWLFIKARLAEKKKKRLVFFSGSVTAGLLALGTKEVSATLPFFVFLYEWYFFQDLSKQWLKRHLVRFCGLFLILGLVVLLYLGAHPFQTILSAYTFRDFTLAQRVLTEFRVVLFYISLLLFPCPSRLNLQHDFPLSYSLIMPATTLLSISVIAGLIGLACYLAKKEPLVSFCILWFFGNLLIESSIIGLEIVYEHRNYLPSMLAILIAVILIHRYIRPKWLMGAVLGAMILICALWTYQRNIVWSDDAVLWNDCVAKAPSYARPRNNLGNVLVRQGKTEAAIRQYREALRISPNYADAHNNLGFALASRKKFQDAIDHYTMALQFKPNYVSAHFNLGNALNEVGKKKAAIAHYLEALRLNADYAKAHSNLANLLAERGETEAAITHYNKALRISPDYADAHNNLANLLAERGETEAAITHYNKALRISPDYADAHNNLGLALAGQKKFQDAIRCYREALRLNPEYAVAHYNLARALVHQGRIDEAVDHFEASLRIQPHSAEVHYNLGNTLMVGKGKSGKAVDHYLEALRINPGYADYAEVQNNLGAALAKQGNLTEAVTHFSRALEINPDYSSARRNLEYCLQLIKATSK